MTLHLIKNNPFDFNAFLAGIQNDDTVVIMGAACILQGNIMERLAELPSVRIKTLSPDMKAHGLKARVKEIEYSELAKLLADHHKSITW